jgi:excisionase family DNA binding protein
MNTQRNTRVPSEVMTDLFGVAARLVVSERTVERMVLAGKMPPPMKLGRLRRWRLADLESWIASGCPSAASWVKVGKR